MTYRSKAGGTLLHAEDGAAWFTVAVFRHQVAVHWSLGGLPALRRMRAPAPASAAPAWTTLRFYFAGNTMRGVFLDAAGHEDLGLTASLDTRAWQRLVTTGTLHLGGIPRPAPTTTPAMSLVLVYSPLARSPPYRPTFAVPCLLAG
ncbi:hypothetical protein HF086_010511 [Spodoptera exigua]|uniref:Uncharacterized protein n=1 Tax=Spodoptera exigua TaxID=7107 RepID=A0A922MSG2_SPOEX|nr:hypothetical protein HF086_010511 [Spodoptera exigua]